MSDEIIKVAKEWLSIHDNIMVSISGGADSDVVLDIVMKASDDLSKVRFIFFDTGIEYEATLRHLTYLEERYNIYIERLKPVKNVPWCCTHEGVPFMSKYVSENIARLQKHNFDWTDEPLNVLLKKYPRCRSALRWWCNDYGASSRFNISNKKFLKEFIMAHPPDYNISAMCCTYAKKDTSSDYVKDHDIDLIITGVRKSEGGVRAVAYKSCYNEVNGVGHYRPIWLMTNDERDKYCADNNIIHSDCYTKYKMTRTGCAGCPFDKYHLSTQMTLKQYEPKLHATVRNLFGKSREYMNMYLKFAYDMKKSQ